MKRTLLALAASAFVLCTLSSAAFAGAVGPALAPIDWSGPYWGVVGGGGWGQSKLTDASGTTTGDFDVHGGLIGVDAGYNWAMDAWVLGLEADASLSTLKGSTTTLCGGGCETDLRWLGTLRGTAGYSLGKFMPYITGGLAVGEVKANVGPVENSDTRVGWTAGGGLAYAFTTGFSIKAEYLYTDLGHVNVPTGVPVEAKADDFQTLRVGLNFAF